MRKGGRSRSPSLMLRREGKMTTPRYGVQFEHVLKPQSPHVSVEMWNPPSSVLPVKPGGTQSESSAVWPCRRLCFV